MMRSRTAILLRRERMETTLPTLIDLFIATKQTEGRSPKTTQWYKEKLLHFAKFSDNGQPAKLKDLNLDSARSFIASLQERDHRFANHPYRQKLEGGLSRRTVHGYVRTLKVFSGWLYEESFTASNLLERLKPPKVSQPVIEILSDEELDRILKSIHPNTFLGARQYLAFLLLLDTGIRASELCTLTLDNVHLDEDFLKVKGKGNKERLVPICTNTKKAIIRYLNTWRPEPATSQYCQLILTDKGQSLTPEALLQVVKRLGKKAGVPRLHPHLFRHTFAVKYLMNGGDVMTLKSILGHTTLAVTQVYMHLADVHVRIQHSKFSPADRLNIPSRKRSTK